MTTYVPLGSRKITGGPDNTDLNPGNWTVVIDPATLNVNVPYYEVAHITVNGAVGSSFSVYIDGQLWDTNQNGNQNSWDPQVALPMRPGQYIYFFWSDPVSDGIAPVVTVWLRYDQDIAANLSSTLNQPGMYG